jgi:hypothetical protein
MATNKRTLVVIASMIAVALAMLVGVMYAAPKLSTAKSPSAPVASDEQRSEVDGDLAKLYKTVDELTSDAQVIALGQFEGKANVVPPHTGTPPYDPGRRELAFRPTEVLKGVGEVNLGSNIQIAQRAITVNNTVKSAKDDTLFQSGDTCILFLTPALPEEGKFYWVTGAMQGALRVVDGKVYSRNLTGEIPQEIGPTVDAQPLAGFISTLREKVNAK